MERLLQYIFDGLSLGSIYALLALGLVVVFRGTGHLNFAQGEMAMICTFFTWQFHAWGLPLVVSVLLGMVAGFALGAGVEVSLIRRVAKKSEAGVFVVSIAMFLGFNSLAGMIWGNLPPEEMPSLFPDEPDDFVKIFGAVWRYEYIGIMVVALLLMGLLFLLFARTKFGLAMRAVASNPESARLVGIPTGLVLASSWGIAAAMGALSGAMVGGLAGELTSLLMFTPFIYASASATLGGFDSPGGAVIAGLAIGVGEQLAAGYAPGWIGQELRLGVALVTIFVVLLFKPSGLFGSAKVERV
ncbi:MAG: branched-chain amino acid ABC transporter permease [Acidimicrobiales bacterium mtb01]|nr:branched-chain amino acid ABC transporter permease [Actinomycetota bacterium]TEX45656.1 MAG: branched-chain amino acid ABC transporter permease [Acidimicrobiales bacterium mtb01]